MDPKGRCISYRKMRIFQPAMSVYQRVACQFSTESMLVGRVDTQIRDPAKVGKNPPGQDISFLGRDLCMRAIVDTPQRNWILEMTFAKIVKAAW